MLNDLHLLLAGPFVLYDDTTDHVRILVPDLLDTHYKPGFTATNNSAELDNGVWTLQTGKPGASTLKPRGSPFDSICCPVLPSSRAYAVLRVPKPDHLFGISPTDVDIISGSGSTQTGTTFATRAVLVYELVDLDQVTINPHLHWNPTSDQPALEAIGTPDRSVGLLVLDMRPIEVPTDDEHARMAYRNMARMVGVDRYMRQSAGHGGMTTLRGKYNDCGAAMILVTP
jgi:hypothetical protein